MAQDARRRREERARKDRMESFLPKYGKYLVVGVVLVAAVGAAATFYKPPPTAKFAHEHASFALFVEGEHISFRDMAYDQRAINDKIHMHIGESGGGSVWHIEARFPNGIPDVSLGRIFAQYGVKLEPGHLKLDTLAAGHNGSEYRDAGNKTVQVYVSKVTVDGRQPFEKLQGNYAQYIPRDLDKILVTYGDPSPDELARQQNMIPEPPGVPPAAHGESGMG